MPLRLYNTLTRRVEDFTPRDPSKVTFYTCGPTVYDDAHIGNFRSFLAADVLRRWIESPLCELRTEAGGVHTGPRKVVHVMNITDVGHMTEDSSADGSGEDKMAAAGRRLAEAKKAGKLPPGVEVDPGDPYAIADFYARRFVEDATRLGMKVAIESKSDPSLMPRATANVPGMIEMIRRLIERGHAYAVGPPRAQTVYFHVPSFPDYGRLSGNTLEQLREGAGERVSAANQAQKRHPADFMLWKVDPSHVMRWDSPWGAGYPGWHIECSVMSLSRLAGWPDGVGEIDLHSGGEDNIFPHHECEIAQSCCATGRPVFARMWFHTRFLVVEGEKMSKRKGNFFTARDLFERGHDPAAVRLELIKGHHGSQVNLTEQGLKDAGRTVERWRRCAALSEASRADPDFLRSFADAMNDDLNVAEAIARVNEWLSRGGGGGILHDLIAPALGVDVSPSARAEESIGVFLQGIEPSPEIVSKLEERLAARRAKDFARADAIRDEILKMGYAIRDVPGGKVEVTRA